MGHLSVLWQLFYKNGTKYWSNKTHLNAWCLSCLEECKKQQHNAELLSVYLEGMQPGIRTADVAIEIKTALITSVLTKWWDNSSQMHSKQTQPNPTTMRLKTLIYLHTSQHWLLPNQLQLISNPIPIYLTPGTHFIPSFPWQAFLVPHWRWTRPLRTWVLLDWGTQKPAVPG